MNWAIPARPISAPIGLFLNFTSQRDVSMRATVRRTDAATLRKKICVVLLPSRPGDDVMRRALPDHVD